MVLFMARNKNEEIRLFLILRFSAKNKGRKTEDKKRVFFIFCPFCPNLELFTMVFQSFIFSILKKMEKILVQKFLKG